MSNRGTVLRGALILKQDEVASARANSIEQFVPRGIKYYAMPGRSLPLSPVVFKAQQVSPPLSLSYLDPQSNI